MFFHFQTKPPVSNFLDACLSSIAMIRVDKSKKALKHSLSVNFHKTVVVSYSHADSVAQHSNHFYIMSDYLTQKYSLMVMM